jgi:uncharacterized protein
MPDLLPPTFTAFAGPRRLGVGELAVAATAAKQAIDAGETSEILIFEDSNARTIEIDFRGSPDAVQASVVRALEARRSQGAPAQEPQRGPGRPKLGVVAREVTLLPRHWDWLATQRGGASVALRRLVEEAAKDRGGQEKRRLAQEAAYRFMSALAGDRPHYEDAVRALFADDAAGFAERVAPWPADVRDYATKLAAGAFGAGADASAARP